MGDIELGERLSGGGDSGSIIRIGDTVRRPIRPQSASVHALLRHLEAVGFVGAPRVSGIDERGREILTFIPGVDGRVARCYDDDALAAAAAMVREYHDAVADFMPPAGSVWRAEPHAPPGELLCHNDLSPANTIYLAGKPRAFIDWDLAVPSTAGWDLSYAARTFVPLYAEQDCISFGYDPTQRGSRLRLFCDAYGMSRTDRCELLPLMHRRLAAEISPFAQRCRDALSEHEQSWTRQLD